VSLIEDKGQFVSTTVGRSRSSTGRSFADLATRLGVDPATISNIQGLVQEYSTDLRQGLTTAQTNIQATRASLAQVKQGQLSSQTRQDLQTLRTNAASLQTTVVDLEKKIRAAEPKVPAQLQSKLSDLAGLLSNLNARLTALDQHISAVLKDPSKANVVKLDPALRPRWSPVWTTLLDHQAVQHPGELVIMQSDQLSAGPGPRGCPAQRRVVLPILALLLYLGPSTWRRAGRRETMISVGSGILAAALLILLVLHVMGGAVVNSVVSSDSLKPAATAICDIVAGGLRERALFVLVVGVAFIAGGVLAGARSARHAVRRFLAAVPPRPPRRGLLRSRRAVPPLADDYAHDQQPRTGPSSSSFSRCSPYSGCSCSAGRRARVSGLDWTSSTERPPSRGSPGSRVWVCG